MKTQSVNSVTAAIKDEANKARSAVQEKLLIAHSELSVVHAHLSNAHTDIVNLLQKVRL